MRVREKLLLRQVDLWSVHSNATTNFQDTEFFTDNENDLLKLIRNYGKFNFNNSSINFSDIFKIEDDQDPQIDHEVYYKCVSDDVPYPISNDEQIVVDFSANRRLLRDSIINITVQETKDLIESQQKVKQPPSPLTNSSVNPLSASISPTEDTSSAVTATTDVKSSKPTKKKRSFRPKITINNCNGIINLRNIANLTINCAKEVSLRKAKSPASRKTNDDDEETVTSTTKEGEGNCEFYERLLEEIKQTLVLKKTRTYPFALSADDNVDDEEVDGYAEDVHVDTPLSEETPDSTVGATKIADKKFVLKNFENLKIILESIDGADLHPVQIEQWLAEIVTETEIEPVVGGEIFEHSEITS